MPLLGNQNNFNTVGMIGVRVGNNFYISEGISATEESLANGQYLVNDAGYFEVDNNILILKGEPRFVTIDGDRSSERQISNNLLRERG